MTTDMTPTPEPIDRDALRKLCDEAPCLHAWTSLKEGHAVAYADMRHGLRVALDALDALDALRAEAADTRRGVFAQIEERVEEMRDYEDMQESQADAMDMPGSAKHHEKRRLMLREVLTEIRALIDKPAPEAAAGKSKLTFDAAVAIVERHSEEHRQRTDSPSQMVDALAKMEACDAILDDLEAADAKENSNG